jgi:cobalt-zinc-cadmium efflux system membrane fusion protein
MKNINAVRIATALTALIAVTALGIMVMVTGQGRNVHAETDAAAPPAAAHGAGDGHGHEAEPAAAPSAAAHGADDGHGHAAAEGGAVAAEAHADEVTLTPEAIQQNGIRVEPVRKMALGDELIVPGRVSYNLEQMAHIGTPVQGRVAEVRVKLGDAVAKGDVLLVIDSPALGEAQSEFLQKRTQVEVAASAVEVAQTAAERAKRLLVGKGIALGEYQRREGEHKSAAGALKSAKSALTAAENTMRLYGVSDDEISQLVASGEVNPRYTVRAPMDGQVVEREVTMGEVVGPDRDALLKLADMKVLWVLADLPENQIQRVVLKAPVTVTLEAFAGQSFPGTVAYLAPELNKETRTVQVRIEIGNVAAPISPGMFAQVGMVFDRASGGSPREALAVPEAAVQMFEGGPTVFVAVPNEPNTFASRPVKVGLSNGKMIPVLQGLEEGTGVIVEGAFLVKAEIAKGEMEGKTCSGH